MRVLRSLNQHRIGHTMLAQWIVNTLWFLCQKKNLISTIGTCDVQLTVKHVPGNWMTYFSERPRINFKCSLLNVYINWETFNQILTHEKQYLISNLSHLKTFIKQLINLPHKYIRQTAVEQAASLISSLSLTLKPFRSIINRFFHYGVLNYFFYYIK